MRGEARIETHIGHHDAEAVRPDQPHAIFLRGAFGGFRQRSCAMAEAGRDNERARAAAPSRLVDETRHRAWRRGDHHEFGDERHVAETANGGNAVDVGITRIDEGKFALEFRLADVVQNSPANGPLPRTAADQRDRARRKQVLQAIGRHVFAGPAGGGCVDGNSASHQAYGSRIIVRARQPAK